MFPRFKLRMTTEGEGRRATTTVELLDEFGVPVARARIYPEFFGHVAAGEECALWLDGLYELEPAPDSNGQ